MLFVAAKLFCFLIPFQFAVSLFGIDIPMIRLFATILFLLWGVHVMTHREAPLPPLIVMGMLLGWIVVSLFGILHAEESSIFWRRFLFLVNFFPLILVWYTVSIHIGARFALLSSFIIGALGSALAGLGFFLAQFIFGVPNTFHFLIEKILPFFLGQQLSLLVSQFPSLLVNIGGATWLRLTAFFPDPHVASYFFGMAACLALGLFLETKKRWLFWAALMLGLADMLTFSRGGYLGLGAALITIFIFRLPKRLSPPLIVFLLPGLVLISLMSGPVVERFLSTFALADASSTERLILWKTAWEVWSLHPWFGLGLGQYAVWVHPSVGISLPYYAHNLFLDIGVETGWLGLGFFLFLIGRACFQAWRAALAGSGLSLGILAALVLYLTHSLFETALFSVHVTAVLTLLMAMALHRISPSRPVR